MDETTVGRGRGHLPRNAGGVGPDVNQQLNLLADIRVIVRRRDLSSRKRCGGGGERTKYSFLGCF